MPKKKAQTRSVAGRTPRAASKRPTLNDPKQAAVDAAIAAELAPAAAIAVLEKSSSTSEGENAPAMDVLVAGVAESASAGKVQVQLLFANGAVLPIEMSKEAGEALEVGLAKARQDDQGTAG